MHSVKYAIAFGFAAAMFIAMAAVNGGWAWLAVYPAISFALVASAYARFGTKVFGKRANGTRAFWATLALAPYLALQYAVWHSIPYFTREGALHSVGSDLWVGRRLLGSELTDRNIDIVIDLTCEFVEPALVRAGREYYCYPLLDVTAPHAQELLAFLHSIPRERICLIHCAQGHGRTGMVSAAFLLVRGSASSIEEALEMVRRARPGVSLKPAQRAVLQEIERLVKTS